MGIVNELAAIFNIRNSSSQAFNYKPGIGIVSTGVKPVKTVTNRGLV